MVVQTETPLGEIPLGRPSGETLWRPHRVPKAVGQWGPYRSGSASPCGKVTLWLFGCRGAFLMWSRAHRRWDRSQVRSERHLREAGEDTKRAAEHRECRISTGRSTSKTDQVIPRRGRFSVGAARPHFTGTRTAVFVCCAPVKSYIPVLTSSDIWQCI